jgi:hypothetical protein
MSWVAISDDTSVRVFWYGYDGQPKSQLLRADTRVAVLCGIPFISFGELCLVTGYETGESATIVRLGNAEIAPVSYFLSCNVHVSKLPDGDEIVSCATYDDYCEITDVYRISANDRQYARILRLPPAYMGAYYCTPFVYSADMQKVIAAQSDQKYDIDLIAPIIPTTIAIGGDVFILRHICDTRDNRALLQAVMRSVSEDGNIGRHTYLLEYNLRTNDSIMITEIDDDVHKRNVVYVAQNIVVVTMVRRRNEIYRLQRLVINLADMTKYLVSDDIVRD